MELQIDNLHKQAVDAALASDWEKAVLINQKITVLDAGYLDAYLALGFAYMQLGKFKESRKSYQEALSIDPNNVIARNNIDKLTILAKTGDQSNKELPFDMSMFMNIRGKTQVISLLNVGKPDILASLHTGEKVDLRSKKRHIEVRNSDDEYIGALPDDISKRLIFFIEGKSVFGTFIKAATKNSVDVFIREEKKGRKVKNFISFPDNIQDDLKMIIGLGHDEENAEADEDADGATPVGIEHEEERAPEYDSLEEFDRNAKEDEDTYFSELEEDSDDDDDFDE